MMAPVIKREGYFLRVMFGLNSKLIGARNEGNGVDNSS